jgi:hypothetical protein
MRIYCVDAVCHWLIPDLIIRSHAKRIAIAQYDISESITALAKKHLSLYFTLQALVALSE